MIRFSARAHLMLKVSTTASGLYGSVIRNLRGMTKRTLDKEPRWRHKGDKLTTGAHRTW